MPLQLVSGHLARQNSTPDHLTLCPCNCTVLKGNACKCVSTAYGTIKTRRTNVTISGSMTGVPWSVGTDCLGVSGTCPNFAGTYIVNACTSTKWCAAGFVCTSGGFDYYNLATLEIGTEGTSLGLQVVIRSGQIRFATPSSNPYPTPTICSLTPTLARYTRTINYSLPDVLDDWEYELSPPCYEECNNVISRTDCETAVSIVSDSTALNAVTNGCDPSSLSVAISSDGV